MCGLCAGGCTQSRVHGTRARTVGPTVGEDPVFCFALILPGRGRRTGPASDRSFARRSFALTCLCTPSKVPKMAEGLCTTSSSPLRAPRPTPGHPTGRYRPPLNARPCDPRKERVLTSSPEPHETSCRRNGPGRPWPSLPPQTLSCLHSHKLYALFQLYRARTTRSWCVCRWVAQTTRPLCRR